MTEQRLEELFRRYLDGSTIPEEDIELLQASMDPAFKLQWARMLDAAYDNMPVNRELTTRQADSIFNTIIQSNQPAPVVKMKSSFKRWIVAASILLLLTFSGYFLFFTDKEKPDKIVSVSKDLTAPVTNRAVITLANGKKIYLDSSGKGTLTIENNIKLIKTEDGQIIYENSHSPFTTDHLPAFNTLTNPRGSKVIDMQLSDGSHVWLNAGSSVTYPVVFNDKERKVIITGEAYFEVSHNASKPFIVSNDKMSVEVLGTHFNVNSYEDEAAIRTTLLEGSVKVKSGPENFRGETRNPIAIGSEVVIRPGQQAVIHHTSSAITINSDVNLDETMAWKNGLFAFNHAGVKDIMRQVSRWYDVDVVYEGQTPVETISGEVQRNLSFSQMLKVLQLNNIKFRIEGKKIIISN